MSRSKIEWLARPGTVPETWNPITGCSGCAEYPTDRPCWAERMSWRLRGRFGYPEDEPFKPGTVHMGKWNEPFHWFKPRTVFVTSMGDLCHESVSFYWISQVMSIARQLPQHTFMVLTKRPWRLAEYTLRRVREGMGTSWQRYDDLVPTRPIPDNVWVGTSISNQRTADMRIPALLEIESRVRWVSYEPALGPLELEYEGYLGVEYYVSTMSTPDGSGVKYSPGLDWIVAGGETGPGARAMDLDWIRSIRDQCTDAGAAFFFKGGIINGKRTSCPELDGRKWEEFPDGIQGISVQ